MIERKKVKCPLYRPESEHGSVLCDNYQSLACPTFNCSVPLSGVTVESMEEYADRLNKIIKWLAGHGGCKMCEWHHDDDACMANDCPDIAARIAAAIKTVEEKKGGE